MVNCNIKNVYLECPYCRRKCKFEAYEGVIGIQSKVGTCPLCKKGVKLITYGDNTVEIEPYD
jgi:hypothetical protein